MSQQATPVGPFTQEDPIGLAGGLNLYGYGDGDPLNNSDPFGLCPLCIRIVAGVFIARVVHFARDRFNGKAPRNLTEAINVHGFEATPPEEAAFHQPSDGSAVTKVMGKTNGTGGCSEHVYPQSPEGAAVLEQPGVRGTYNYGCPRTGVGKAVHLVGDVVPWIAFGDGRGDHSTFVDRARLAAEAFHNYVKLRAAVKEATAPNQ